MLITKIEKSYRKGYFNVYVDDSLAFTLLNDDLVKEKLKVGLTLSEEQRHLYVTKATSSYYFSRALNFLSFRLRTKAEVEKKLNMLLKEDIKLSSSEKEDLKAQLLQKLAALRLIDDENFAKIYASTKLDAKKPIGKTRIKMELLKKGIPKPLIEKILEEEGNSSNQILEDLVLVRLKAIDSVKAEDLPKLRRRLCSFLLRRGFPPSQVFSVVDTIIKRKYNRADLDKIFLAKNND
ncbi:MAG: RecX family transcriptional regulator [Patescibacteria group bacterium]